MIHKNWKKRLKSLKKDKEVHLAVCGVVGIPLLTGGLLGGIGTGKFLESMLIATSIFSLVVCMFYISEVFFVKNSELDNEIKETTKQTIKNDNHHEKYSFSVWSNVKQKLRENTKDTFFYSSTIELTSTISYIFEHVPISLEEQKYFVEDFPNEMIEIVNMYKKLQGDHRERMKLLILSGIEQKKKEWEERYIEPMQTTLEEECAKKVKQVLQEQKEQIYMTD